MQVLCEPLVMNSTMSHICWAYGGFGDSARACMTHPTGIFRNQKSSADLFEAFVGALSQDGPDGEARLLDWLRAMLKAGVFLTLRSEAGDQVAREKEGRLKKKARTESTRWRSERRRNDEGHFNYRDLVDPSWAWVHFSWLFAPSFAPETPFPPSGPSFFLPSSRRCPSHAQVRRLPPRVFSAWECT